MAADMAMPLSLPLAALLLAMSPAPMADLSAPMAEGAQHRDQDQAWEARRQGHILPLKEIERRVVPTMPGAQYIGVDFDPGSAVYTLKFLRDGAVIWVDVDGRSGQIVGRTDKRPGK